MNEECPEEQSYFMEEHSPGPAGLCLLGEIRILQHWPQAPVTVQISGGLSRGAGHTKDTCTDSGLVNTSSCVVTACSVHVIFKSGHVHAPVVIKCDVKAPMHILKE